MCEIRRGPGDMGCVYIYTEKFGKRKAYWVQSPVYFWHSFFAISHQSTVLLNYGRIVFKGIENMDRVIKMLKRQQIWIKRSVFTPLSNNISNLWYRWTLASKRQDMKTVICVSLNCLVLYYKYKGTLKYNFNLTWNKNLKTH